MLGGAFATLLQAALAATFAWMDRGGTFSTAAAALSWVSVLSLWGVGICWWRMDMRRAAGSEPSTARSPCDEPLRQAQREYLREHWLEAEMLVRQILMQQPGDVEARLLRASILRRTGRQSEAQQELLRLAGDPRAAVWRWEIETELRGLADRSGLSDGPPAAPAAEDLPAGASRQAA